jgi:hypothetical protein
VGEAGLSFSIVKQLGVAVIAKSERDEAIQSPSARRHSGMRREARGPGIHFSQFPVAPWIL